MKQACRQPGLAGALAALAVLALLGLLGCSDDDGPRTSVPDAGLKDARVPVETPDAAQDATMIDAVLDAGQPDGGGAGSVDASAATTDAGAPPSDAGADASDASAADPARDRVSLVDHQAWIDVPTKDDPWSDQPSDATCDDEGYGYEVFGDEDSYFVNTAKCAYKTATQELLTDVRAGEELTLRLWHFELTGPDGAEAHVALRVGDQDLLDEAIPLPAPGMLLIKRVVADQPIPAGTPVMLHIHNHGANEYYLLELSTGPVGS